MNEAETNSAHNRLILDRFSRTAVPFAEMPEHSEQRAMRLLLDAVEARPTDRALDVCCGPGLVACALAPSVEHVTGVDITPLMIEQAGRLQSRLGLNNMDWRVADVSALPFADESFSIVLSRYAFHHLLDPARVLREMVRVSRSGGRVLVADVYTTNDRQDEAFNRVERLRDPSHARALRLEELREMFDRARVTTDRTEFYRLEMELESLLTASRTEPDAAVEVRRLLEADIDRDDTGLSARREGGAIRFSFPVVILAGRKS